MSRVVYPTGFITTSRERPVMCTPSLLLLFKLALQSRVIPPHSRCDSRSHTLWGNPREETTECLSSTFSAFKYHFSPDSPSNLVWVQWMPLSPSTRSCSWSEWADVVTCQAYIGTFEKNYWHHGPEGESDNVCLSFPARKPQGMRLKGERERSRVWRGWTVRVDRQGERRSV